MRRVALPARTRHFRVLLGFMLFHLVFSSGVAFAFVQFFNHRKLAMIAHLWIVCGGMIIILMVLGTLIGTGPFARTKPARYSLALIPAVAFSLLVYLYALNGFSNTFWGRNITYQLVLAYTPSILSGKEPLPFGRTLAASVAFGVLALNVLTYTAASRSLFAGMEAIFGRDRPYSPFMTRARGCTFIGVLVLVTAFWAGTLLWGINSDWLIWNTEMVVSFFRPNVVIFEPTPRRNAIGERDEFLRAHYPRALPMAKKKNVILILVDSLRADHMQIYGYARPTTPFLTSQVEAGRMQRVNVALSTCSESYCGITSTLASKEFRDISPRNFKLHDVLRDQGYKTWFILSGNHLAWYNLSRFYGDGAALIFDGAQSQKYGIDDDRVVLEGLERVPDSRGEPAFFYIHLMSTHYAGVKLADYRTYTHPDAQVEPGRDPHEIFPLLDHPDRYDDKVIQADDFVRQIFDLLTRKGYLEDGIVIVTADHGEGLGERHYGHGWHLYQEDIRIPLLIFDDPSVRYANLQFATLVDVAPTILDRLGLPIPASWEGRSLLHPDVKRYSFHQTYFHPIRHALVYRSDSTLYKYIAILPEEAEELYDLTNDPLEARNLIKSNDPVLVNHLRDMLREYLAEEGS